VPLPEIVVCCLALVMALLRFELLKPDVVTAPLG
jgi:hypothetical protein